MTKLFDFQKLDLTNDDTFVCGICDELFQVFSSSGGTMFCPSCGAKNIFTKEVKEE